MSSSKDYLNFILEQLNDGATFTYRPMMGEFLLYCDGVLFGGVYDNRLLIKKTTNNSKFNLPKVIPYEHAKVMYQIEDIDNREMLNLIISVTVNDLKN